MKYEALIFLFLLIVAIVISISIYKMYVEIRKLNIVAGGGISSLAQTPEERQQMLEMVSSSDEDISAMKTIKEKKDTKTYSSSAYEESIERAFNIGHANELFKQFMKYDVFHSWMNTCEDSSRSQYIQLLFTEKPPKMTEVELYKLHRIFARELTEAFNICEIHAGNYFLDIGFTPGGFTLYMLEMCRAVGEGIALSGNMIFKNIAKHVKQKRFKYVIRDLTKPIKKLGLTPKYDFVMIDGVAKSSNAILLLYMETMVAFDNMKENGDMIIRLNMGLGFDVYYLCFLLQFFGEAKSFKPASRAIHRKSYYGFFRRFNIYKYQKMRDNLFSAMNKKDPFNMIFNSQESLIDEEIILQNANAIMNMWAPPMRLHISALSQMMHGKKAGFINPDNHMFPKSRDEMILETSQLLEYEN